MDTASIDWITTVAFAIIGGGLIGLVMGHKIKKPIERLASTPLIFQSGPTNTVLTIIGLSLIALCFTIDIWHGLTAIVIGFITETIIGARVSVDENGGIGKAIKTI